MSVESRDDRTLLGRLADDPQFTADLDALMTWSLPQRPRVLLDLSDVHYMNSSNIAKLLRLRKLLIEHDGHMLLVRPSPQVWSVFTVTGLDKVFQFAADLDAALAAAPGA